MDKSIFVIESDIDIANMLKVYFSGIGYKVWIEQSGKNALGAIRQYLPTLVVTDVVLPDIDGYEVCQTLRAEPRTSKIPVVFLTQKSERSDKLRGLEYGVDDYITKPFDIEALKLRIARLIRRTDQPNLWDPITGLPSRDITEDFIFRISTQKGWSFLNISVESIETFEERYGFILTNQLLRIIRDAIGEVLTELGYYDTFGGHIDECHFAIIIREQFASVASMQLRTRFAEKFSVFCDSIIDFQSGEQFVNKSRDLDDLVSIKLTIGCVNSSDQRFSNFREIVELSAELGKKDQIASSSTATRLIEEQILQKLDDQPWALLDIFIRYFDAYQEVYPHADAALIALLAQKMITEISSGLGDDHACFIDHQAKNHFWIITSPAHAQIIRETLKSRFSEMARSRYYYIHQQEGFIRLKNGEKVPLMDLAIGIVVPSHKANPKVILKMAQDARLMDK